MTTADRYTNELLDLAGVARHSLRWATKAAQFRSIVEAIYRAGQQSLHCPGCGERVAQAGEECEACRGQNDPSDRDDPGIPRPRQ